MKKVLVACEYSQKLLCFGGRAASASVSITSARCVPAAAGGSCGTMCRPIGAHSQPLTQSPCRNPCARPCTFPSGWLAVVVPSRKCGTAFARCASKGRRAPSLPAVVRTGPRVSDEALCTKPRVKGVVVEVGQFVNEFLS